jgi:hypothetical protein
VKKKKAGQETGLSTWDGSSGEAMEEACCLVPRAEGISRIL